MIKDVVALALVTAWICLGTSTEGDKAGTGATRLIWWPWGGT